MTRDLRSGFTLIEMIIVGVVIGILATIAIPKFSSMRTKSYVAAVTSDLKNMANQQELCQSDNNTYGSDVTDLDMTLTANVSVTVNEADGRGWAATATHSGLGAQQCGIFYGSASASNASPATQPGTVVCD